MKYLKFIARKDRIGLREGLATVDFSLMDLHDPDLANSFLEDPIAVRDKLSSDFEVPVTFKNIPNSAVIPISEIKSKHVNKFITIIGLINQTSLIYSRKVRSEFECMSCGQSMWVHHDRHLKKPYVCEMCDKRGFKEVDYEREDEMYFYVMEDAGNLDRQPIRQKCILPNNLCKKQLTDGLRQIGTNVKISGILKEIDPDIRRGTKTRNQLKKYLEVVSVEFEDEIDITIDDGDILKFEEMSKDKNIMEILCDSFAPHLVMDRKIKAPLILQQFGGIAYDTPGVHTRGDIHILMIGDPSAGKSQLLKFGVELAPKARLITGGHATGVGMTASVNQDDDGNWYAEAGALVLANNGLAGIEEFNSMKADEKEKLKEALEEQKITINKAGVHTSFNTRTAVLASCNPKHSSFDRYKDIPKQFNIESALLSRFDIKILFFDNPDEAKDAQIAEKILLMGEPTETKLGAIDIDTFRKYILYAKQKCTKISVPENVRTYIVKKYVSTRKMSTEDVKTALPRTVAAVKRLAQARAKISLRTKVNISDVEYVWDLYIHWVKQMSPDLSLDAYTEFSGILTTSRQITKEVDASYTRLAGNSSKINIEDLISEVTKRCKDEDKVRTVIKEKIEGGEYYEPRNGQIASSH